MRLLADLHISPRTVAFLNSLGHDVIRTTSLLPANASDELIVAKATEEDRIILTQDLDFSALIALGGRTRPSLITLRLSSSAVEFVNSILQHVLPQLEHDLLAGAVITVHDKHVRSRRLPLPL